MKFYKITSVLVFAIFFFNCKKNVEQRADNDSTTTVFNNPYIYSTPPCSPDSNSCYFNSFQLNFSSSFFSNNPSYLSSGYKMSGSTYPGGGFSIEFKAKPRTQKYVTNYFSNITSENEVYISGTFGIGLAQFYSAQNGDTVYVKVIDEANDVYSASFCNLEFNSGSAASFRTDGNLLTN